MAKLELGIKTEDPSTSLEKIGRGARGALVLGSDVGGVITKATGGLRGQLARATGGISSPVRALAAKKAEEMRLAATGNRIDSAETMVRGALDVRVLIDSSASTIEIKDALVSVSERLGSDLKEDNPLLNLSYGAYGGGGSITVDGDESALRQANVGTDSWKSSLNEALAALRTVCDDKRLSVIITFNDAMPSENRNGANLGDLIRAYNGEDTVHVVCYVPSAGSNETDHRKLKDLCDPELGLRHAHFFDFSGVDTRNPEVVSRFLTDIIDVIRVSNPRVGASKVGLGSQGISEIALGTKRTALMHQVQSRLLHKEGQGRLLLTA